MANLDDMADEHGLSRDSMRGSEQFIRPDLIGDSNRRDDFGRPLTRNQLSIHEATALEQLARQRGDLAFEIEADKRITPRDDLSALMRGADPIPDVPPTAPPMSDGLFPSERAEPRRLSQIRERPAATTVPPEQAPEPLQSPGTPATRPDAFPASPTTAPATTIDVPSETAPETEPPPPTEPPNMAATPPPVGGSPASPPPLG